MKLYRPTYTRKGKTLQSKVWWTSFTAGGKRFRLSTGQRVKKAAMIRAAKLQEREELRAAGVPIYEATETSLSDLLDEYRSELKRRGTTQKHIKTMDQRCRFMLNTDKITQITPQQLRRRLLSLEHLKPVTRNEYLQAAGAFFKWLNKEGRWRGNPADKIVKERQGDPAEKGVLTWAEIQQLISTTPPQRHAVYWVTATTGLRRNELKHLLWSDLDLETGTLSLGSLRTKNKKRAVLPLMRPVVQALKVHERSGARVFPSVPRNTTLKRDLERAGLALVDSDGNPRTLHSLRTSLATNLALAGVPLTLAQKILRHSDPALTANVYTKHSLESQRKALGHMLTPSANSEGTVTRVVAENNEALIDLSADQGEARDESRTHGLRITKGRSPLHRAQHQGPVARLVRRLDTCLALLKTCPAAGLNPFWDAQVAQVLQEAESALFRSLVLH